ncbi:MAG: IclR family transcriptional regulator [Candidatus Rokubacteria bacterium]|nr:IclR family transcriptional regulator [Candidatus Rokubacteria bacterium]
MKEGDLVKTVARAADLLYWLATSPRPARFSEICRGVRLGKPVVHRLLSTLEHKGLIAKNPQDRVYSLGAGIATLAANLLHRGDLISKSQPAMRELWEAFGETVTLSIRVEFQRFCIYQLESPHPLRYTLPLGRPLPLYAGATGKLLLAMMPDEKIDQYLAGTPLVRLGPTTPTDAKRLRRELLEVRRKAYATSTDETGPGGTGIATAIYGAGDECIASVGLFAPKTRMSSQRLHEATEPVLHAAQAISSAVGALVGGQPVAAAGGMRNSFQAGRLSQ